MRDEIASGKHDEFGAGELQIGDGVVIGDSWEAGDALSAAGKNPVELADLVFFVPLPTGRYGARGAHRRCDLVSHQARQSL